MVCEKVLLPDLCERKILFRLRIYDRLRQATGEAEGVCTHLFRVVSVDECLRILACVLLLERSSMQATTRVINAGEACIHDLVVAGSIQYVANLIWCYLLR